MTDRRNRAESQRNRAESEKRVIADIAVTADVAVEKRRIPRSH